MNTKHTKMRLEEMCLEHLNNIFWYYRKQGVTADKISKRLQVSRQLLHNHVNDSISLYRFTDYMNKLNVKFNITINNNQENIEILNIPKF